MGQGIGTRWNQRYRRRHQVNCFSTHVQELKNMQLFGVLLCFMLLNFLSFLSLLEILVHFNSNIFIISFFLSPSGYRAGALFPFLFFFFSCHYLIQERNRESQDANAASLFITFFLIFLFFAIKQGK